MSRLASVQQDGLVVTVDGASAEIGVKLSGTCDSKTKPLLELFLEDLHLEATRRRASRIVLDCENLYFINSASVKTFVTWLNKIKLGPSDARYSVSVRTNRYLTWQQRTFGAISRSAPDVLSIVQ